MKKNYNMPETSVLVMQTVSVLCASMRMNNIYKPTEYQSGNNAV